MEASSIPSEVLVVAKRCLSAVPPFGKETMANFDKLLELCKKHGLSTIDVIVCVARLVKN